MQSLPLLAHVPATLSVALPLETNYKEFRPYLCVESGPFKPVKMLSTAAVVRVCVCVTQLPWARTSVADQETGSSKLKPKAAKIAEDETTEASAQGPAGEEKTEVEQEPSSDKEPSEEEEEKEEEEESPPEATRKRGRRKRGRPRKDSNEGEEEEDKSPPAAKKLATEGRKRGRPPKRGFEGARELP